MSSTNKQLQEKIKQLEWQLQYVSDIPELISDLDKLFTDKIQELHEVKGMQTERHAFSYYRSILWKIRNQYKAEKSANSNP